MGPGSRSLRTTLRVAGGSLVRDDKRMVSTLVPASIRGMKIAAMS
jgi:hypothetical protein